MAFLKFVLFIFLFLSLQLISAQELDSLPKISEIEIEKIIKERTEKRQKMIAEFENFPTPHFKGTDLKNVHHQLSDYEGHVLILFFWDTFCQTCLDDLTVYNQLREGYDLDLVTIISFANEPTDELQAFIDRYYPDDQLQYPIIPNAKQFSAEHFGGSHIYTPRIFVVDKYQTIRKVLTPSMIVIGEWNVYQLLKPLVDDLLKE